MLLGMPVSYLEVRLLFALVGSIEVGGAENTQLVLTGGVVVGELIGIVRSDHSEASYHQFQTDLIAMNMEDSSAPPLRELAEQVTSLNEGIRASEPR